MSTELSTELLIKSPTHFDSLAALEAAALVCRDCRLCETREHVVVYRGNPQARLMIIGEGPGQKEDETGKPFVGRAGQLLDKILEAGNIDREKEVYICNVVKCRPPNNRVPMKDEVEACRKYLTHQIHFIKPAMVLLAGTTAVQAVLQIKDPISKIRGKWFDWANGVRVMPIFHPSYLLRFDSKTKEPGSPKWHMWQDIKEVRTQLDLL